MQDITYVYRSYWDVCESKVISVHTMRAYKGSRNIAPPILNFGTRWQWVVNFTRRLIYPRKRPSVSTEQKAEWAPKWHWTFEDVQNLLFLPRFEALTLQPVHRACIKIVSLQRRQIHNKTRQKYSPVVTDLWAAKTLLRVREFIWTPSGKTSNVEDPALQISFQSDSCKTAPAILLNTWIQ